MFKEEDFSDRNGITKLIELYEKTITKGGKLEELDLIGRFFNPLRAEINQGRYDYRLVKAWQSATNLLDLKVQALLDKTLQKGSIKELEPSDSELDIYLTKSISPLARPISKVGITKAYVELMIQRKKRHAYNLEDIERMGYEPVDIEPVSIEVDKNKLIQKIKAHKKSSIDFVSLLEKRTWEEVIGILNILLHLAHEKKIKLHQDNFPEGKIIITYQGEEN